MFKEILIIGVFMFIIQIVLHIYQKFWDILWKIPEKTKKVRLLETEYKEFQTKFLEKQIIPLKKYLFVSKILSFFISFIFIIPIYMLLFHILDGVFKFWVVLPLLIIISMLVSPLSSRLLRWFKI